MIVEFFLIVSDYLLLSSRDELELGDTMYFSVYLLCTSKPAFVVFWVFWVHVESITCLFSEPSGRSMPSLATATHAF